MLARVLLIVFGALLLMGLLGLLGGCASTPTPDRRANEVFVLMLWRLQGCAGPDDFAGCFDEQ